MKTCFLLSALAGILLSAFAAHGAELDKTGTIWWPYVEWSIDNSGYTDNPFDVIATATFTHTESGEERTTGLFYDGGSTWKLRFTGTRLGEWSFTTTSDDPELDGHNGTMTINPNSDPNVYGFVTAHKPIGDLHRCSQHIGYDVCAVGDIDNVLRRPADFAVFHPPEFIDTPS